MFKIVHADQTTNLYVGVGSVLQPFSECSVIIKEHIRETQTRSRVYISRITVLYGLSFTSYCTVPVMSALRPVFVQSSNCN